MESQGLKEQMKLDFSSSMRVVYLDQSINKYTNFLHVCPKYDSGLRPLILSKAG